MPRRRSLGYGRRILALLCVFSLTLEWFPLVNASTSPFDEVFERFDPPGGSLPELRDVDSFDSQIDVVVLLVSESVWEDDSGYLGLLEGIYPGADLSLKQRIERYAEDIQETLPFTEAVILTIPEGASPIDIQRTLQEFYLTGDPELSEPSQLAGIVLIGEVPVPVVNKNGHRFLSLFPYTDLVNPVYVLDESSQDFVWNESTQDPQVEIWHGVIRPPATGEEGAELLAKFFDKNHSYHSGEEEFVEFDDRILMADLVSEANALTPGSFQSYDLYTDLWEVIAFGQYRNDLIEEAYLRFLEMDEGDGLDNDGDGTVDEEPQNGIDDDGDSYTDEDLGDPSYLVDNDSDGAIDEDGYEDNNYDGDYFVDEDPSGDLNGDDCPGACGEDDDGDSYDHDGDGYPTGWEIENGYSGEEYNVNSPYVNVRFYVQDTYAEVFDTDEEAYEYLAAFYVDEVPSDGTCSSEAADDDEDGFCDEDTSEDNDADLDGQTDEDPSGFQPESRFEEIPDIQAKSILESIYRIYVQIFDGPLGDYNRFLSQSGRYDLEEDMVDSMMSLIAEKDSATLVILKAFNDYYESRVNEVAEELQEDIPLVAYIQIKGTITEDEDDQRLCNPTKDPGEKGACIQLVNHSALQNDGEPLDEGMNLLEAVSYNFFYSGQFPWRILSVAECTIFRGTEEEEGQFVEMNLLYSHEALDLDLDDTKEYKGCVPDNAAYTDDIEEICFPVLSSEPVFAPDGGHESDTDYELGYGACYEYRDFDQFITYNQTNGEFSDWLSKQIRRLRKKEDLTAETYEEWLVKVEEKRTSESPTPWEVQLRKNFEDLYLIDEEMDDETRTYTLQDLFDEAGLGDLSEDELDIYMTFHSSLTVVTPEEGSHMDNVDSLKVQFVKTYFEDEGLSQEDLLSPSYYPPLTTDASEALTLPSIYYHTDPSPEILNAQIADGASPNLPIDATRRVSFMDSAGEAQTLVYLNVFDAENLSDLEDQLDDLVGSIGEVEGGEAYIEEFSDLLSEKNLEQLEDALDWANMSLDEKHAYVLTHYLGDKLAYTDEAEGAGYEMMFFVGEGSATELELHFNAAGMPSDEELAWLNQLYEEEATEVEIEESTEEEVGALLLSEWLDGIKQWAEEIVSSVSEPYNYDEVRACGGETFSPLFDDATDADDNGVPDSADLTVTLVLTTESDSVIRLNGEDYYIVSVSARTVEGGLNIDDNFTEVQLVLPTGEEIISIGGTDTLTLTNGVATFLLEAENPGDFSVQALAVNRSDLGGTNILSGTVADQYLKLSTYKINEEGEEELLAELESEVMYLSEVTVGEEESIIVRAQVMDINGVPVLDDNTSRVQFILSDEDYGTLLEETVTLTNGQAETLFNPGTLSGTLQIEAELLGTVLPVEFTELEIQAGAAQQVELSSASQILPAGAESTTALQLQLVDAFGNMANAGFYKVSLEVEGGAQLIDIVDEDRDLEGTQVTLATGELQFQLLSSPTVETVTVVAEIVGQPESQSSLEIEMVSALEIEIEPTSTFLPAGSSTPVAVNLRVVNSEGRIVTDFQGDVTVSVSDPAYGNFEQSTISLDDGEATVNFYAGTKSGLLSLQAESPGFSMASASFQISPGDPYALGLKESEGNTILEAGENAQFVVEVYDAWGNLVTDDFSTEIALTNTELSSDFSELPETLLTVREGQAEFTLEAGNSSGPVGLSATAEGLLSDAWEGEIRMVIDSEEFKDLDPQLLFGSFLGAPFGDISQEDYLAGWLTFNGKTQATLSLLEEPEGYLPLASLDAEGRIDFSETAILTQNVLEAGSTLPVRIQWRDFPNETLLAEIFYVLVPSTFSVEIEMLSADPAWTVQEGEGVFSGKRLFYENQLLAKVTAGGQIELLSADYHLELEENANGMAFIVMKGEDAIARITLILPGNKEVTLLPSDFDLEEWDTLSPGLYIRPTQSTALNFETMPTGNSSENPMGLALVDPEQSLPENQKPSLSYHSIEEAGEDGSIGWEGDNKHLQLFAAGNTAGESTKPYASEIGILLGDPTITLPSENVVNEAGFTSDLGAMVHASEEDVQELLTLDYNDDGREDVLMVYSDHIDLLQNLETNGWLEDMGTLLAVPNGISEIESGDLTGDGLDDLLILTENPCYEGEQCIYLYRNIRGGFAAESLTIEGISGKPKQIQVADLNQDDYADIVLADENLNVSIVWNEEGTLLEAEELDSFGLTIVEDENLKAEVLLHWSSLESGSVLLPIPKEEFILPEDVSTDLEDFLDDLQEDSDFISSIDGVNTAGEVLTEQEVVFDNGDSETVAAQIEVTKNVEDLNGGNAEIGDRIQVTLTFQNLFSGPITELYIADLVAPQFSLDDESFNCATCGSAEFTQTGSVSYPWVYGPLTLSANGSELDTLVLTYEMEVVDLPQLELFLGHDLATDIEEDDLIDIGISIEANDTGTFVVFASSGFVEEDGMEKVNYVREDYNPEESEEETSEAVDPFLDLLGMENVFDDIDPEKGIPVPSEGSFDAFKELMGAEDMDGDGYYSSEELYSNDQDSDGDGLSDLIDPWNLNEEEILLEADLTGMSGELDINLDILNESLEGLETEVQDIVDSLRCNGGCLAMPSSISFLTPGYFHDPLTGQQLGWDQGWPVFGLLLTPIPVPCSGATCLSPSSPMRVYLSPTTTLGLTSSICLGPYPTGQCYSYNIPLLDWLGICDALNSFISEALSGAADFTADLSVEKEDGETKLINISVEASVSANSALESAVFSGYSPPVVVDTNIQVPGFPDVFTEWWKLQKMEFSKLLDLPDLYFIYPDFESAIQNADMNPVTLETNILGLESAINLVHSLPLITVTPEKVHFRFPWLTPEEIEVMQDKFQDWLSHAKEEFEELVAEWESIKAIHPELEPVYEELRRIYFEAVATMENNLDILESYSQIPYEILEIREAQAYYARVVVCYIDAILQYLGGYYQENLQRIVAWAEWVTNIKDLIKGWQVIWETSIKLMDSCDKCTNQRYSTFQTLANLFTFIPDFPVLEFPKWPDIVLDVSSIEAGIEIKWPDIEFVPQPLSLPELPEFDLPSITLAADLSTDFFVELPVLPQFDFDFQVPELPGLQFPELPSLPPPPTIPPLDESLSGSLDIVTGIIRLVCIIRQGFIPTPEFLLKTQVEDMTQRPASYLLPADLEVTVDYGNFHYNFLRRIEIMTFLNLSIEFGPLLSVFEFAAEEFNSFSGNVYEGVTQKIEFVMDGVTEVVDVIDETTDVEVDLDVDMDVDLPPEDEDSESMNPLLTEKIQALEENLTALQVSLDEWDEEMPDTIYLEATSHVLSLEDPLLSPDRFNEIVLSGSIDPELLAEFQGTPIESLAAIQETLVAETLHLEEETAVLAQYEETGEFLNYLALNNEINTYSSQFASSTTPLSTMKEWNPEKMLPLPEEAPIILSAEEEEWSSDIETYDGGLYIIDESLGLNGRLIDYTAELMEPVSFTFLDVDLDGDRDIVYSLGGDVYLKENHTEDPDLDFRGGGSEVYALEEIAPNHGILTELTATQNGQEKASFTFDPLEGALGYEVLFYDSLDALNGSPDQNILRGLYLLNSSDATLVEGLENRSITEETVSLFLEDYIGDIQLLNGRDRVLITANGQIETSDPLLLQTLKDSEITLDYGGEQITLEFEAGLLLQFPAQSGRTVRLENGELLWIKEELVEDQEVYSGMALFPGEKLSLNSFFAKATVMTSGGYTITLDQEEEFFVDELTESETPIVEITLENGAYYTTVTPLFAEEKVTRSPHILLHPQICADESDPFALVDSERVELALFTTMSLSAEASFDADTPILTAYWDLDASVDSDSDGDSRNDVDVRGLNIEIGPYEELEDKEVTVWVRDGVGNHASSTVYVDLYVPALTLTTASTEAVFGNTEPMTGAFPFHLIRERDGIVTEIGEGYLTLEDGSIEVTGFETSELLGVYNQSGEQIAEFNPATKQVLSLSEDYEIVPFPGISDWPTHLSIVRSEDSTIMGSFIVVSDEEAIPIQSPVSLVGVDLSGQEGLVYHQYSDEFEETEEGLALYDLSGDLDFLLTPAGDVLFKSDRYRLEKVAAESLEEFLILRVYENDTLILEFYPGAGDNITLTIAEELELGEAPLVEDIPGVTGDTLIFEDIDPSDLLYEDMIELVERGILEGYEEDGKRYFKPDQLITRAEFTKIVLGVLCIVPSEEAEILPEVFNDILDPGAWYFPYTKEAYLQSLITGYLGEMDASGLTPFKPNQTITRAEAAKIILEALDTEGILVLPDVELAPGEPWFAPYLVFAQDLTPYLVENESGGEALFILTPEEARDPYHLVTRYEFVLMSVRALQAYDCYEENLTDETVDLDSGIYGVSVTCTMCPCEGYIDYEADIRPGDIVFAIIQDSAGTVLEISNRIQVSE